MAQKKNKKTAAKATTKSTGTKLNDSQLSVAQALTSNKDGLHAGNWDGDGKFPTRTFQSLEKNGLAKSKEKKLETGKKAVCWFPTAKTAKVVEAQAA